jgi:hypothetical protein
VPLSAVNRFAVPFNRALATLEGQHSVKKLFVSARAASRVLLFLGVAGWSLPAQAGLVVTAQVDNQTPVTLINDPAGTPFAFDINRNLGGAFNQILGVASNSPGGPTSAEVIAADFILQNMDLNHAHTLQLIIGDTGFSIPSAPPALLLTSSLAGSVTTLNSLNALTFQSFVDGLNRQNYIGAGSITSSAQSPDITQAGLFQSDASTVIANLAAPYSITEVFTITLGGGGSVSFTGSPTLSLAPTPAVVPAPEPGSVIVWSLMACGIGGIALRRSKADRVAAV